MFEKTLSDLVRGIRAHKSNEVSEAGAARGTERYTIIPFN